MLRHTSPVGSPEHEHAHKCEGKCENVEQTVPKDILPHFFRRGFRMAGVAKQVMPLENLVKDDPVDEPAQAQAENEAGPDHGTAAWRVFDPGGIRSAHVHRALTS